MMLKTKGWELTAENRLTDDEMVHVYKVDSKTVVKLIDPPRLAEAEALRLVRAKTSIPVPEVYDAYIDEAIERGVIVMEYIEGDVLRDVWDGMNSESRESVISQLGQLLNELRSITADFIGSVDRSPCYDPIFTIDMGGFGPYQEEKEFHNGIIRAMNLSSEGPWTDQIAGFIKALPTHRVVLTHSDLTPRNILIRGNRIVGIVDWEMSGFYPEYWEYVKALYYPNWDSEWYRDGAVDRILPRYEIENAVMMHVQNIL